MMRFTVFDRWGNQIGVINDVIEAVHKDEVNGEDSLTLLLASCDLIKGNRIVWRDKFGYWHEHIVNDLKEAHEDDKLLTTAYCENSIAELFTDYIEDLRPYDTSAYTALQRALSVTRWQIGTVDVSGTSSAIFYHISAREAIGKIIEAWGGEFSTTIEVEGEGVSARKVNIATRGRNNGKRFEWSKDIKGITREVSTDDVVTALYGYGKGLEAYDEDGNATGGYERKLTFGDINGGLDYVADETAKLSWGLPDGKGGIKHAFGKVELSDCEDMRELLELTKAELAVRCKPQVSYTANVVNLADAGFEYEDTQAGDTVALIDKGLNERLTGRVLCIERYLFNEQATVVTLGNVSKSITDIISSTQASLGRLESHSSSWDGAASISTSYINAIINSLNNTMNQTGGYTYYKPGEGIITYDKPEDQNPTMAIQIKGAGFRIANTKDSNGDWSWRTFGTGSGFTADEITAGVIRGGNSYWNLETGELVVVNGDFSGRITATSGTIGGFEIVADYLSSPGMRLTGSGVAFSDGGVEAASIGASHLVADETKKAAVLAATMGCSWMGFAAEMTEGTAKQRFGWSRDDDQMLLYCGLDGRNHVAKNLWLDASNSGFSGGQTVKTLNFCLPTVINSDGTIGYHYHSCYLEFRYGVLVGYALPVS